MRQKKRVLFGLLLLLTGGGVFLYPNFREWKTKQEVDRIAGRIRKQRETGGQQEIVGPEGNCAGNLGQKAETEPAESEDLEKLYAQMLSYNERLVKEGQQLFDAWSFAQAPLDEALLPGEEHSVGYIEIPDMEVRLPLFLGASEENLARGAAVLSQTSMPIGGESTNCVIAGHRGYRGSPYFQYIEQMKEGSWVYVTNPWETLAYRVTETRIILPDDVQSVVIRPGKDMVTLLSCHPYAGGGKYRYVVFCERADGELEETADKAARGKTEGKDRKMVDERPVNGEAVDKGPTEEEPAHGAAADLGQRRFSGVEENGVFGWIAGIDLMTWERHLRRAVPLAMLFGCLILIWRLGRGGR